MVDYYSIEPTNTYAYLGPRIELNDYEVGSDIAQLFIQKVFINNSWYVDIGAEAIEQLKKSGIKNIEDSKLGTFKDNRFYSYRRDKNKSGRIFTIAMLSDF